jgi:AraC-like DNA-binding protein
MLICFDNERPSDSPYIERVWRSHSEASGNFVSIASSHWEIVFTRLAGNATVTLRGPETKPREVHCPANGEWLGIRFRAGTFMPSRPIEGLIDGRDVTIPQTRRDVFRLDGSAWKCPSFDNAETFVARLVRSGVVARDAAVSAALQGDPAASSQRSTQRHFRQATGMTQGAMRQIERARYATLLLQQGVSIGDTIHAAGFFDQAHLTRALKRLIGLTPMTLLRRERQLSFLYNTAPPAFA